MIVALFTGSREWADKAAVVRAFEHAEQVGIHYVVTGDQRGLDRLAYEVARDRDHHVVPVHAWWKEDGRVAGHIRNSQMIATALGFAEGLRWYNAWVFKTALGPPYPFQFVHGYAFPMPGSVGTWNCCDDMKTAGIAYDLCGTSPRRGT